MGTRDSGLVGYTFAAAARRIGVSRARVSQLVRVGRLATLTLDNRRYISPGSLSNYLAALNAVTGKRRSFIG